MTEKPGCVSAQTNIVRKWDDLIDNKYLKLHTDKHVQTELQGAVCQRRCLRKAPMKKFKVKYVSNSTHARAEWSNFPRSPRVVRPHSWNSWNWCLFFSFEGSRIQKKNMVIFLLAQGIWLCFPCWREKGPLLKENQPEVNQNTIRITATQNGFNETALWNVYQRNYSSIAQCDFMFQHTEYTWKRFPQVSMAQGSLWLAA